MNNNLISAALFKPNSVEFPSAWVGHLPFAAWLIQQVSPKIFVELGTHSGNSYFSFCQSVVENALSTKCYAIDTWGGDEHSGLYNEDIFNKVNAHNHNHYAKFSTLLRMTFDEASTYFSDQSINILHIDGLHTYEAVRHDFETWLPKLATDAFVIFHDINVRERNFGVWKLWEELQARYPNNLEFKHSHGLGVLNLKNSTDANTFEWLQSTSKQKLHLINYFEALGSHQFKLYELNEIKQLNTKLDQAVVERDLQIANQNQTLLARDESIVHLKQAVAEKNLQIDGFKQSVLERDTEIKMIKKSFLWRITRPVQFVINKFNPLRTLGRRASKVIRWTITLQIGKKFREWRLSKKVANSIYPHYSPPKNDYSFKVPFNYILNESNDVPKLAVIFHIYYPELLEEFKRYLANIPFNFDLFITTDTELKKNQISEQLLDWNKGCLEIRLAPNRGRDIAPKLISCRDVYDSYEFFLHIHTKKSPHLTSLFGWRTYLLDTLIGSKEIVMSIFEAFESDPKLGMIAPEHFDGIYSAIGWGWNFEEAKNFAERLDIKLLINNKVDFPSGSMFWGRSAALRPLLNSNLSTDDFQPEESQTDATLAHTIERLYYFICEKAGYNWIKITRPELIENVRQVIFVDDKNCLKDLINVTQYGLLASTTSLLESSSLSKIKLCKQDENTNHWRLVHAKSNMRTMEFSLFCAELEKHILNKDSQIDFDESFYFAANPDLAENNVTSGFVHYCLFGQYENRLHSDNNLKNKFNLKTSIGQGLFYPQSLESRNYSNQNIALTDKPLGQNSTLLILVAYLQEELFFAGYSEFFKDHVPVFKLFDQIIVAVENAKFDKDIAFQFAKNIEVINIAEVGELLHKPDIILTFNAHLTCKAFQLLPESYENIVYFCQDYESGFFPYGKDYIIGKRAVVNSKNLILSTELLKNFFINRNILNDTQNVFVTKPKIETFEVTQTKTNRLFFYYRPESFQKRNLPEALMDVVNEFCNKHNGYEIFMVGAVATSYSFKLNGTQVYVISKLPKKDYIDLISSCDVVVSMIYSAHPGVIAFQAAASGIPTVTNVFENRDSIQLKEISNNIVPYDPVCQSLLSAIEEALTMKKGHISFNETLYYGNQTETLVDYYKNILKYKN